MSYFKISRRHESYPGREPFMGREEGATWLTLQPGGPLHARCAGAASSFVRRFVEGLWSPGGLAWTLLSAFCSSELAQVHFSVVAPWPWKIYMWLGSCSFVGPPTVHLNTGLSLYGLFICALPCDWGSPGPMHWPSHFRRMSQMLVAVSRTIQGTFLGVPDVYYLWLCLQSEVLASLF